MTNNSVIIHIQYLTQRFPFRTTNFFFFIRFFAQFASESLDR